MSHVRNRRTSARRMLAIAVLVALGLMVLAAAPAGRTSRAAPAPPEPDTTSVPGTSEIRDTPANLQAAFTNEMNARERYNAFAKQAEADTQPGVARLFRACAKAESVHARRFVQAIAYTGQPARALLERLKVGTTEQNLRAAISLEQYEIDSWYPALLERASADGQGMAVRAITLALGAERTHLALLQDALVKLPERPLYASLYVCPFCGRVVDTLETKHCPGCYTPAGRFLKPV